MFSNEEIIKWVKKDFVPVAVSISYLQFQKNREGLMFRKIAEQGHYAGRTKPTPTRQGLYIATIDGRLLASANPTSPIEAMRLMQKGLNAWNRGLKNSAGIFSTASAEPVKAQAVDFPKGGLILRQAVRDLPRPDQPYHRTDEHNFDHVWLTAEEVEAFSPSEAEPGSSYVIPEKIVRRLVRWHLVDQVKGESDSWRPENILEATMRATVTQVKNSESNSESGSRLIRIKLGGSAKCAAPATRKVNPFSKFRVNTDRGIEAVITGWLTYDFDAKAFTEFDMLAVGDRWGATIYNFRHQDLGRSPIGFAFKLLEQKPENKTKPAFAYEKYFSYQ